jgi:hypothetical protein
MMKEQAKVRTLHVATVQVASQPGQMGANRTHALPFIETDVGRASYALSRQRRRQARRIAGP